MKEITLENGFNKLILKCSDRDNWTFESDYAWSGNAPRKWVITENLECLWHYFIYFPGIGAVKLAEGYTDITGCHVKSWHPVRGEDVVESLLMQLTTRVRPRGNIKVTIKRGGQSSTFWC